MFYDKATQNDLDKATTSIQSTKPLVSRFLSSTHDYGNNSKGSILDFQFGTPLNRRKLDIVNNAVGQAHNAVAYPSGMSPYGAYGTQVMYDPHTADMRMIRNQIAERALLDFWKKNREKTMKYDRMAFRPEIDDALTVIVNDMVFYDNTDDLANVQISDDIEIGDLTKTLMIRMFRKDVVKTHFKLHKKEGKQAVRDLLKHGRLFYEIVYDEQQNKIVGLRRLVQHNMIVIVFEGEIIGYRQMLEGSYASDIRRNTGQNFIDYSPNQILYVSLGLNGPGGENDPHGILETAVKVYNQVNMLEDSILMYRVAWGAEKLVFKIDTGDMPKKMAEAYMNEQKNELTRRMDYNRETGDIVQAPRMIGLSEHYFIPISRGTSSSIERLPAGNNVQKVEDLELFKRLLVNAMKVPPGLITALAGDKGNMSSGKMGEITQEQAKYYRMIMDYQNSLGDAMVRLFVMQMALNPNYADILVDESLYLVSFARSNYFQYYLKAEINSTRFAALRDAKDFIGTMFANETVLRDIMEWSDAQILINKERLEREKANGEHQQQPQAQPQ